MANRAKSLYLTDRTMSALRPSDALSGRMNQIVDRYLLLLTEYQLDMRGEFDAAEWQALLSEFAAMVAEKCDTSDYLAVQQRLTAAVESPDVIDLYSAAEVIALIELLESDLAMATATAD